MANRYLKNLEKIEFVATYACTGRCKHCSEGNHTSCGESIDPKAAAEAIGRITSEYGIKTVLVFGGEPLLCLEAVEEIIRKAKDSGVPKRQVITNGYFSNNPDKISEVARRLEVCGVNDLLLSVDAFHQETIPIDTVKTFAREAKRTGLCIRLQPAWMVSPEDRNPYNVRTREILDGFIGMGIPVSEGNIVFPEGNARIYLAEYFGDVIPVNPYLEDPCDVRCLSFDPNGDVLGGNIYRQDIMTIIDKYSPDNM